MFDSPIPLSGLHRFFEIHAEGLQNAAFLLGGPPRLRQVQKLLDDLSSSGAINRRIFASIVSLHELLTLQHVADFDRPESGYFAELDASEPYVEEICALADDLGTAIDDHSSQTSHPSGLIREKISSEKRA